jgi:hypothetical protein
MCLDCEAWVFVSHIARMKRTKGAESCVTRQNDAAYVTEMQLSYVASAYSRLPSTLVVGVGIMMICQSESSAFVEVPTYRCLRCWSRD